MIARTFIAGPSPEMALAAQLRRRNRLALGLFALVVLGGLGYYAFGLWRASKPGLPIVVPAAGDNGPKTAPQK